MAGTKLVIVESPTKAKKIGGYLGKDYTVKASVGHIRDLAQPSEIPASKKEKFGRFGVDVNDGFEPYYVVGPQKKKTVSELKSALKGADELYLATDEDREGEAIAWHLVQTLKPKVPVKRMVFHEITPKAIKESLSHTRQVDADMVDAQETRRVLDRLYGYELSPVLWRKVGPGLSAGRVQSVATRLIVERERERMAFVKAPYWDVTATLSGTAEGVGRAEDGSIGFEARMVALNGKRLASSKDFKDDGTLTAAGTKEGVAQLDEATARRLAAALEHVDFTVTSLETKPYHRRPVPPFTTSTMQQTAGNRLSMSSRQTMRAAQGLYENGYITYMRTDSVTLSQEAIAAARQSVTKHFGKEYLSEQPKQYATKTAGAQEAHECIRPAGSQFHDPDELATKVPPDQLKLYTLIWQRTLASQMADATGSTATVRLSAPVDGAATSSDAGNAGNAGNTGNTGEATFQASGTVIEFPGFLKASGWPRRDGAGSDAALPPMKSGDALTASAVQADGHETQPAARYTEASLVKTLEAKEIGRPSTYASIISTIIDRGYVYERGRALIPSWLAFAVTKLLEQNFPKYVDYQFTADMEHGLDKIAHGEETSKEWLTRFYFGSADGTDGDSGVKVATSAAEAHEGLAQQVEQLGDIDARAINTIEIGDGLQVRVGRYGPYLEDTKSLDAEGNPKHASIPDTMAPDELTVEAGHELIRTNAGGPRVLGKDPKTGGTVEVRTGRFGPYVALLAPTQADAGSAADAAEAGASSASSAKSAKSAKSASKKSTAKKSKKAAAPKPKMASLFKTMTPESVTIDEALKLLSLPRKVGEVEEVSKDTGEVSQAVVTASNGRYGPYLTKTGADGKSETRSLSSEDEIFTVTLDHAKELFAQPKYGRGRGRGAAKPPLRELGADPENGKNVTIKDGFYGAYITDGETNRTLPKQYTPESIDPAEAFRLLAEKRAAGPTKRRRRSTAKKASTKKTTTKKTVAGAKKAVARKTAAKKTAAGTKKTAAKKTATGTKKATAVRKSTASRKAATKKAVTRSASKTA